PRRLMMTSWWRTLMRAARSSGVRSVNAYSLVAVAGNGCWPGSELRSAMAASTALWTGMRYRRPDGPLTNHYLSDRNWKRFASCRGGNEGERRYSNPRNSNQGASTLASFLGLEGHE